MKKVSVIIPTFNEEKNIPIITERLIKVFESLNSYDYEIIFCDNYSTDSSRQQIIDLNKKNKRIKGIFYIKNFGFNNSCYYGLLQTNSDCSILLFADMQDPPELIKDFILYWEEGYKLVIGIKNKSNENKLIYLSRTIFYKLINYVTDINHIEHFDGFGLYDNSFIKLMKLIDDPQPYLRGIVAEYGSSIKKINYTQAIRKYDKSKFNFYKMYDTAMIGFTSYSKVIMWLAIFFGVLISFVCFILSIWTLIKKILFWDTYQVGFAAMLISIFFLSSVILIFIGILGEYILSINVRILKRPIVIEDLRIGFNET